MNVNDIVFNELKQNDNSVWVLRGHENFSYSDGKASEKYLESVFNKVADLSSSSEELELYIKDWVSEYHLSSKRAQLLSGFNYNSSKKVLEVGGGCGAITRFLGETFDNIISIEGNIHRANLAKLRTRDLNGVNIICAPFQEIKFKKKFDVIFCIGVYEYSSSFIKSDDPYEEVLNYFSKLLTPTGVVIIAIENQFGLKYFSSSREDHVGVMFEGIEGYHRINNKVKTFGKNEINDKLKKYFNDVEFYFPYPDYKLVDGVLSEYFLNSGYAGELISQFVSRDYKGYQKHLFDEASTIIELEKNNQLPFFANSFLIIAGKKNIKNVTFGKLGVLFSPFRKGVYSTKSTIKKTDKGIIIEKVKASSNHTSTSNKKVSLVNFSSKWIKGHSIQTKVYLNSKSKSRSIENIFSPCLPSIEYLSNLSFEKNNSIYIEGKYIDATWANLYVNNGKCEFIDQEWIYNEDIKLKTLIIRSIYRFLISYQDIRNASPYLQKNKTKDLIKDIANTFNVHLSDVDFDDFINIEATFQSEVYNLNLNSTKRNIRIYLNNKIMYEYLKKIKKTLSKLLNL